ncbi:MAG TPA: carbohydrate-binding family 9-like protein [Armatimonadota bacterium]
MKQWIAAMALAAVAPIAVAQGSTPPPSVTANYAASPIRLDGRLEEKAWLDATPISLVTFDGKPITGGAVARVTWDKDNLYFGAEVPDERVVAGRLGHDGPLWEKDDVLELFLWPSENLPYYYQFVVNPRPTVYEAFCIAKPTHDGADLILPDWNPDVRVQGRVQPMLYRPDRIGTANPNGFWSVEMSIPISTLSSRGAAPLQAGESWRMQIVRFNRPDPAPGALDASAFSPYYEVASPFLLDHFGVLNFAGSAAVPVAPLVPGTGAPVKPAAPTVAPTPAPAPAPATAPAAPAVAPPTAPPTTPAPTPATDATPAPTPAPANPPAAPVAPAKTVTLSINAQSLKDAVGLLFQGSGLNYLVLPVVASNPVTVEIKDLSLDDALSAIVEKGDAKFHKDPATGVYVIEPKDTPTPPSTPPNG